MAASITRSAQDPSTGTTGAGEDPVGLGGNSDQFGRDVRRKLKLEAYVTSGCGKHKEKIRTIDTFWDKIWPHLEGLGWTKVHGTGRQEGSINFVPKRDDDNNNGSGDQGNVSFASGMRGVKGVDYYDRIRDVLERILERRNPEESAAADMYVRAMADVGGSGPGGVGGVTGTWKRKAPVGPAVVRARKNKKVNAAQRRFSGGTLVDLSWKESNRVFPKKSSKVGEEYQVTDIPKAGTYRSCGADVSGGSEERHDVEVLWDPKNASEKCFEAIAQLPHNKKEAGLFLLAKRGYELKGFEEACRAIGPSDGSNWSQEKRDFFHAEIFRLRKNFPALCESLDIDMKTCLAYYLGTFKSSDDYRLTKTVCVEERLERIAAAEFDLDACAVCGDGGHMLICDGCEGEYHMSCMRPQLARVPEGKWECDQCVDSKYLATWEYLSRNTRVWEQPPPPPLMRSKRELPGEGDGEARPTEEVARAVRAFAKKVHEVLSEVPDTRDERKAVPSCAEEKISEVKPESSEPARVDPDSEYEDVPGEDEGSDED